MDFSKIKKIFYIIAIISMLLSIKSKVLGATVETSNNNSYTVPDFIFDDYYFLAFRFPNTTDPRWYLVISDTTCTLQFSTENNTYMAQVNADNNGQIRYHGVNDNLQFLLNNVPNPPGYISNIVRNPFYFTGTPSNIEYLCNYDVYAANGGGLVFSSTVPITVDPFFENVTEIENGNPDGVFISPGDYSSNDYLYFHLLEIQTGISNQDNSRYYYADKIFALNKDSDYFSTWVDPSIEGYYYYIPRYKLGLSQNSSYLYVLNDSKTQIQNSNGLIEIDKKNGTFDVVESDTTGVITATEEETDRMKNIESTISQNQETVNNINDSLTNSTVTNETETDISNNLNFNSSTPQFSNLFNSYFSQLTSLVADLGNYQDSAVLTINLPVPHTNSYVPIRSDMFSSHVPADIYFIIQMFWLFIFGRYYLKFLLRIYRLASTGLLLDYYSLSGEIITQDML